MTKQLDPITIDPAAPMRSLREAAGLSQRAFAEARGVAQPTQSNAETAGDAVSLRVLREAAKAAGLEIEIRVRRRE